MKKKIKIAHSPDSDDAFMFYAILHKKIDLQGFEFEISSNEIGKLNEEAVSGKSDYDIIALSFHALSLVKDKYVYLKSGASLAGKDYGPRLVCKMDVIPNTGEEPQRDDFKIAIPGKHTTGFKTLQLWLEEEGLRRFARNDSNQACNDSNDIEFIFCSYNEVFDLLENGTVDASLLIHESQLRYKELGYNLIVDLGVWWYEKHSGLRLALGCNAAKKELGKDNIEKLDAILKESIEWSLRKENLKEALDYSRNFANNKLDDAMAEKYIEMYVDESTIELSADDEKSIAMLLD